MYYGRPARSAFSKKWLNFSEVFKIHKVSKLVRTRPRRNFIYRAVEHSGNSPPSLGKVRAMTAENVRGPTVAAISLTALRGKRVGADPSNIRVILRNFCGDMR